MFLTKEIRRIAFLLRKYNKIRHRLKTHEKYPIPKEGLIRELTYFGVREKRKVWVDTKDNFYTWDSLHGEFEVFKRTKEHVGCFDTNGNQIKPAVRGRRINV